MCTQRSFESPEPVLGHAFPELNPPSPFQRLLNSLDIYDKHFICPKDTREEILVATLLRNVGRGPFGEFWDRLCVRTTSGTPPYDSSKAYKRRSVVLFRKIASEVLPHWTAERVSRVAGLIYSIKCRGVHTWCYDVVRYAKKFDAVLRDAQLANIDHCFCINSILRSARTASYAFYRVAFDEIKLSEFFRVRDVLRYSVSSSTAYCAVPYLKRCRTSQRSVLLHRDERGCGELLFGLG